VIGVDALCMLPAKWICADLSTIKPIGGLTRERARVGDVYSFTDPILERAHLNRLSSRKSA
jgi:hypothetical protein